MMRAQLARVYRLLDRLLISLLPETWQRLLISGLLHVARTTFPTHPWPDSAAPFLARRHIKPLSRSARCLPDWARRDMTDLALQVDPMLSPEKFLSTPPDSYVAPYHWNQAGNTYNRVCERIRGEKVDTVILVPWLKQGGADLGAIHHARACHEAFGQRTLVVATEPHDSPWASRLPDGVRFLEIGRDMAALSVSHGEPEIVLARLLIQLAPSRIHIINSHLAWRTIARFGLAIRQSSRIFASLYCDDRDMYGYREGLAQRYLSVASPWLSAVITDNTIAPRQWVETLGMDPRLFYVAHFPAPRSHAPSALGRIPSNRLLWASRLDKQKRPDFLARLAAFMPEYHWDVYGSGVVPGEAGNTTALSALENVTLHGAYDNFASIVRTDHLAFVYTSAWDGLPNVLLEAASAHLPIVAPDIGGIRDLMTETQLIPSDGGIEAYAHAIRVLANPSVREERLQMQQVRLAGFTWERFVSNMKMIPGYARFVPHGEAGS